MNYLVSFLVGGGLCAFAQVLIEKTKLTPARILVGYVIAGVILSGIGVYQPFAEFASSGASVPICGFGHLLAKGVREAIDRDGLIGCLTGGLSAASGGIAAAVSFSLLTALLFKPKMK